jgi:very-short-patch-repair endonuclease
VSIAQAKKLRGNLTDAGRRLWYWLRAHRFDGHKFKRQVPIGPYAVDFACLTGSWSSRSTVDNTSKVGVT